MLSVFHGHILPPPRRPKIDTSHYNTYCNIAQKAIFGHFEGHFGHNGSLFGHYGVVYRVLRRILGLESCCQCSMVISCPLPEGPKSTPHTMILTVIQHKKPFLATLRAILGRMEAFSGIIELFIVFCVVFWV